MTDASENTLICDTLNQRRIFLTNRQPPVRNEKVSPYPNFTRMQLDMRRKVEVLKYNKNSTQDRQLTAKEKQAQILRGNYRGNVLFCADDSSIPVKTSSSDVPGPIITLQEEPDVPLYNYLPNRFASAITTTESEEKWSFFVLPNITIDDATITPSTNLASLLIKEGINQSSVTYEYITPYVLTIEGNNIPIDASGDSVTILITSPKLDVLYENNSTLSVTPVLDVSSVSLKLEPDSSNSVDFSYSAQIYLGYITSTIPNLSTPIGRSYNFSLTYTENVTVFTDAVTSQNTSDVKNNTTINLIANVDTNYSVLASSQCTITNPTEQSSKSKIITFNGT